MNTIFSYELREEQLLDIEEKEDLCDSGRIPHTGGAAGCITQRKQQLPIMELKR